MRVTAAVIMRNEATLIATKLAACSRWADELVVIDQHSEDGSRWIAREVLRLLEIPGQVATMEREVLGKEFSFAQAFEAAQGDWVIFTDVDETLVTLQPLKQVLAGVPLQCAAPTIQRWHAVVSRRGFFKTEEFAQKRFRILRKPGARVIRPATRHYQDLLHKREPVSKEAETPHHSISNREVFLMEFKSAYQHVADQMFYQAVGSRNDLEACLQEFSEAELEIGRALFRAGHLEHPPGSARWSSQLRSRLQRNRNEEER